MTKIYLSFSLITLLAAGCSLDSDTVIVPDVEDEFYIELIEVFDNGNRAMNWKLRTIESVGCEGASISFSFKREAGQVLSLSINQILAPSDCVPADEPARSVVEMGALENGKYPVSVALREALNQDGILSVYDGFYQIELESDNGIIPLRNRLYRIPDRTVWGVVGHEGTDELAAAADSFLEELNQLTQEQVLTNGHYGYFESTDQGERITFAEEGASSAATTVNFQRLLQEGQKAAVIDLITSYRATHDGLIISVFNTYGEEW